MAGQNRVMLARAASRGVPRHSEDADPKDQDGYGFPSDPLAFRRPRGGRPSSHPSDRSRAEALHALSRPFRDVSSQPRTAWFVSGLRPEGRDPSEALSRCCLSWALVPYDTCRIGRPACLVATDPSAAACHVRGLGTPLAASTADPPGAEAPERPWDSPSKAFPPSREALLSEPLPS